MGRVLSLEVRLIRVEIFKRSRGPMKTGSNASIVVVLVIVKMVVVL